MQQQQHHHHHDAHVNNTASFSAGLHPPRLLWDISLCFLCSSLHSAVTKTPQAPATAGRHRLHMAVLLDRGPLGRASEQSLGAVDGGLDFAFDLALVV